METEDEMIREKVAEYMMKRTVRTSPPEGCKGLGLIHIIIIIVAGIFTAGIGAAVMALIFIVPCWEKQHARDEYFIHLREAKEEAYKYVEAQLGSDMDMISEFGAHDFSK